MTYIRAGIPRATGLGLACYGLGTAAAFFASGAPGGDYSDTTIGSYVASGHLMLATVLWGVAAVAATGLLVAAAALRSHSSDHELLAGLAAAGAAVSLVGAFVSGGLVVAVAEGGSAVRDGVPHPVIYTVSEIGNLLTVCGPAFCVGIAALLAAVRVAMPGWARVITVLAGICGVLAPLFFTYFVYVIWAVVAGLTVALRRGTDRADDIGRATAFAAS